MGMENLEALNVEQDDASDQCVPSPQPWFLLGDVDSVFRGTKHVDHATALPRGVVGSEAADICGHISGNDRANAHSRISDQSKLEMNAIQR